MNRRPDTAARLPSPDVGLKEIARLSGVSVITASRALNHPELVAPNTRERVLQAIQQFGFIPNKVAGNLARTQSRIIGTVVPPLINMGIAEQVQGMSDYLVEHGYQLMIAQGEFTAEIETAMVQFAAGLATGGVDPAGVCRIAGGAADADHPAHPNCGDQ